jgi:hypothetical protein
MSSALLKSTPWDTAAFGVPTWELTEYSETALQQALATPGHHTVRVDPLADKRGLRDYGFYYCDTLIEPYCTVSRLRPFHHAAATVERCAELGALLEICHGAFAHGRFHRDFNLSKAAADLRYDHWLKQLLEAGQVYGLYWQGALAGFIGYSENNLVLHAVAEQFRGKGHSKYWWSAVCAGLFAAGQIEVRSSISAANLAVLNLYASLGFAFSNPQDVYHRMTA